MKRTQRRLETGAIRWEDSEPRAAVLVTAPSGNICGWSEVGGAMAKRYGQALWPSAMAKRYGQG